MLISSDNKAVDNFWHHIWNQHIMLLDRLESKENQRILLIYILRYGLRYGLRDGLRYDLRYGLRYGLTAQ